jgi:hypothetical protein
MARRALRRYALDERPCRQDGGNTCQRRYGGWLCWAPTAGSWPTLVGCEHERRHVEVEGRDAEPDDPAPG